MPYTASALMRAQDRWSGADVDLSETTDADALVDLLREQAEGASTALLLLDEDDEYLAIVRLDEDGEPRSFVSDARVLEGTSLAARLLGDELEMPPAPLVSADDEAEEEEEDSGRPELEPAGDPSLLADLGLSADELLELAAEEGMLPSDVLFAVCEKLGCADVLEQVRGV